MLSVDDCIAATGRKYPDGYGFALTFMQNAGSELPAIRAAAFECVRHQFANPKKHRRDSDVARFVAAYEGAPEHQFGRTGSPHPACWWLIEAAQLLVQWGLWDGAPPRLKSQIAATLKAAGHPGY